MSELAEDSAAAVSTRAVRRESDRRTRARLWRQVWPRLVFVIVLASIAFFIPITDTVQAVANGSRTAYVLTTPVLVALIMASYRHPPSGVGDAESDWIVAAVLGAGSLTALELIIRRLPTVAGLWHLQNVQMVAWLMASAMVIFTVRHVVRLWKAWLFAFACALVLPYLLLVYQLGGTDTAAALLAVALGTLATFWATRFTRWKWRLAATVSSASFGVGWVMGLNGVDLKLRVLVGAGLVPILTILAMYRFTKHVYTSRRFTPVTTKFPQRHAWSYVILAALSVVVLIVQLPHQTLPTPPNARPDWIQSMGLRASAEFPFIARFVGPGATLVRYPVPNDFGAPAAAIDVITARNLAALRDFRDVVWYPHEEPVNYQRENIDGGLSVQARYVHSTGETLDGQQDAWYAVTWAWHAGGMFQRVMIVVNQDTASFSYPPPPQAITFANSFTMPLKWILRQQPDRTGTVEKAVVDRAQSLAMRALAAGAGNG